MHACTKGKVSHRVPLRTVGAIAADAVYVVCSDKSTVVGGGTDSLMYSGALVMSNHLTVLMSREPTDRQTQPRIII
jgi:hypothetical protein